MPQPTNRTRASDARFDESIRAELPYLRRTVRILAGDLDADELVQRVLLRSWAHWETLRKMRSEGRRAWIKRTVANAVVDERRRLGKEPVDLVTAVPEGARVTDDTAERYSTHEDMRALMEAVRSLRKRDRDLVLDRVRSDDSMAELARRHDMTEDNARKRRPRRWASRS